LEALEGSEASEASEALEALEASEAVGVENIILRGHGCQGRPLEDRDPFRELVLVHSEYAIDTGLELWQMGSLGEDVGQL
jgi:hypothetical protein